MEQKLTGRTLSHVVFMLRSSDRLVQQRAAMSLAKLAPEAQIKNIFVDKRGLDVLLDMLIDSVRGSKLKGHGCRQAVCRHTSQGHEVAMAADHDQIMYVRLSSRPSRLFCRFITQLKLCDQEELRNWHVMK